MRVASIEVKDLFERKHHIIRGAAIGGVEERRHLRLPALVYRMMTSWLRGICQSRRPHNSRQQARQDAERGSNFASRTSRSAASISGQTCAWRALYSSIFSGRTLSRKQARIASLFTC